MLPIDMTEIIEALLDEGRRENDYQLHASGHMLGSLRHAQLDVAGAPRVNRDIASLIRMETGTMWHTRIANRLRDQGIPVMAEVTITPWLPKGWSGTPDLFLWNPEYKAFGLIDVKTIKGDGIYWIERDGAKQEHIWQTSLYWHGAKKMGLPLIKRIGVFYLPVSEARKGSAPAKPTFVEFDPLPWETMRPVVEGRWKSVSEYLDSLPFDPAESDDEEKSPVVYLTDKLAPVQERVFLKKANKTSGFTDVSLAPHWSAAYCEFPLELCDCSLQSTNKVGHIGPSGTFIPNKLGAEMGVVYEP
jgi:hypothetical protein